LHLGTAYRWKAKFKDKTSEEWEEARGKNE